MPHDETKVVASSSASARIIAAGIVIAFCYWASAVLVTLLISVLAAYFLDPVVTWLENIRLPRALGSLLVVLLTLALLAVLGWSLIQTVDQFSIDWPQYRQTLRAATQALEKNLETLEAHVSEIEPTERADRGVVTVTESHAVRDALIGRLSSLSVFLLGASFVPFLVFFMLAGKRQVWHATMQLFPTSDRTQVRDTLTEVTQVLRSYLMGTALVGLILVLASWLFFWGLGLDFPFLTALVSGMCNLVPYLGAIISFVPPTPSGPEAIPYGRPFCWNLRRLNDSSYSDREFPDSRPGRVAHPAKCAGAYPFDSVLGLDVGFDGSRPRDSDRCCR